MTSSSTAVVGSDRTLERRFAGDVITYRDALQESMRHALDAHDHTMILGQGVNDHKAIFGTTIGLAEQFGSDRVIDTPLAEEGMTGIALGAALNGLYPIHTHIRTEFGLVAMNQIVNLAAKYKYMFGGRMRVPMLIRIVIGRGWGQGAQHSQSGQSLFAHIPGLVVLAPAHPQTVLRTYEHVIESHQGPVLSFEHRLLYDLKFQIDEDQVDEKTSPLTSFLVREGDDVTVVATSIMMVEAKRAADHLAREAGISCDLIDLHCVSHPNVDLILASVAKTGRLLVADTSWIPYGVCAEICRIVAQHDPTALKAPVETLGLAPAPCPTAKSLEDLFYPNLGMFVDAAARLATGRVDHGIPLPNERSMRDVYMRFKGPF